MKEVFDSLYKNEAWWIDWLLQEYEYEVFDESYWKDKGELNHTLQWDDDFKPWDYPEEERKLIKRIKVLRQNKATDGTVDEVEKEEIVKKIKEVFHESYWKDKGELNYTLWWDDDFKPWDYPEEEKVDQKDKSTETEESY